MLPTISRSHARRWSAAAVAVASLAVAGCSDDSSTDTGEVATDDDQGDALPNPGSESFSEGDFDAIPIARGATEASERTEREGAISQSYTVSATSPTQIMEYYVESLPDFGWEAVEPVRETGTDSYAAAWVQGSDRLEISALLAQGVEDERTQFSVVLLPDRTAGEDINDPATTDDATDDG